MDSHKANADELILQNRVSRFLSSRARLKAPLIDVLRRFSERRLYAVIFVGTLSNRLRIGRQIYSSGFFEAIRARILDINLEENPFPELSAIRTLVTASTLKYGMTKRLARYVVHHVTNAPLEYSVDVQLSHYGRARLDTDTIHAWLKIIRGQINTQSVIRVPLEPAQLPLWKDQPVTADAA